MPSYDDTEPLDQAIASVFPRADPKGIHALLDRALGPGGEPLVERVRLACVLLSEGDLRKLEHYLRQAACDSRDVLYWAYHYGDEPPAHMRSHLRDFRR